MKARDFVAFILLVFAVGLFVGARIEHNIVTTGHAYTVCGDSR